MALNFRAHQSSLETKDGKKLWYPILVKDSGMITIEQLGKKISEKSTLTIGDVYNVIHSLISEFNSGLMNGHSVNLEGFGSFTVIARASGKGVEDPADVNASQIKSLRVQFTPSFKRTPMQGVTRAMFEGVTFQRWSGDPYNPQYKFAGENGTNPSGGDDDGDVVDPDA